MSAARRGPGEPGSASLAPLVEPRAEDLSVDEVARYARHLSLPGIGPQGQRRLAGARVLVVGAGGLGSPALLYLAAAGVGTIGIVDDDVVDTSNLQRQVIHGGSDVGRPKVTSATETIAEVNPHVRVVEHAVRLDASNALDVLAGYDVVLDGADNFATRYLVSDAAEISGIPVVWGSIYRFGGQVSVFWGRPRPAPGAVDGPAGVTYRDVFPEPPPPGAAPDCATGGVLGAMCGTIGSVMATEAVKLVTGAGTTLLGRLAVYGALDLTWRQLTVRPDPTRPPVTALLTGDDAYAAFCGVAAPATAAPGEADAAGEGPSSGPGAGPAEVARLLAGGSVLLDVREEWEAKLAPLAGAHVVPSGRFVGGEDDARAALAELGDVADLTADGPLLVVCAAGIRSARVVEVLRAAGVDARDVLGGAPALRAALTPRRERTPVAEVELQ
ncbi:ThiF family adenylyltransferase [Oerskovia flava]|uniref:ThiF family adenylyltransferase n=1 Tax=Oerskovia flava TaxID=2986422 RepID=UPI00223FC6C5|nr:ThiF family adenylyltransferase [Oerskovia sp. JB1-3-2]